MKAKRHNSEQKKPKGFKPGSRKGSRVQRISDAVKLLHTGETDVWVTHSSPPGVPHEMWRLKLSLVTAENLPAYPFGGSKWAFLRCREGIGLFVIWDYKGERLVAQSHSGNLRTITKEDIMAIVIEKHLRPSKQD